MTTATRTNTNTLRALTALADKSDVIKVANAHDSHLASLAQAHTRTIRLTSKQSQAWEDDEATRRQMLARARRRANTTGKAWIIVSRASILLATVNPQTSESTESTDSLDFGDSLM